VSGCHAVRDVSVAHPELIYNEGFPIPSLQFFQNGANFYPIHTVPETAYPLYPTDYKSVFTVSSGCPSEHPEQRS
ncbi:MAG: hypothetical protein QM610_06690, partial [Chitinophagaceae bacterium]